MAEETVAPLFVVDPSMIMQNSDPNDRVLVFKTSDNRVWTVPSATVVYSNETNCLERKEVKLEKIPELQTEKDDGEEGEEILQPGEVKKTRIDPGENDETESIDYSALFILPGTPATSTKDQRHAPAILSKSRKRNNDGTSSECKSQPQIISLDPSVEIGYQFFPTPLMFCRVMRSSMASWTKRVSTFFMWDESRVTSSSLARAGFTKDTTRNITFCFVNNCRVDDWRVGDVAWKKHSHSNGDCPYVQLAAPPRFQYVKHGAAKSIDWEDPSYYFVRLLSLRKFAKFISRDMRMRLAGAGFIGNELQGVFCFVCRVSIGNVEQFEMRGERQCPTRIHARLNCSCDFIKMIG